MLQNKKTIYIFALLIISAGALVYAWYFGFLPQNSQNKNLTERVGELGNRVIALENHLSNILISLQGLHPQEVVRREVIREKSQEELLTLAVSKTVPSVVSIVVTKDVPKLEVVYINPFGDDPFFRDFNIRVPQYRQKGTEQKQVGAGTGFIVASNGYILTNRHVVEDTEAYYMVLLSNGSQKIAQVIWRDSVNDVALLKIDGSGYSAVELGSSDDLKLGQSVFAIGNALGEYSNSVSVGIISGLNRSIEAVSASGIEKLTDVIQTDAAINPGNSGGPLVDLQGKIIGINVAMVRGSQNIAFAIPVNTIKKAINDLLK